MPIRLDGPGAYSLDVVGVGDGFASVRVLAGEHAGYVGYVLPLWLKPPDAAPR